MKPRRLVRFLCPILLLALLGWGAGAAVTRAAMVTETSGASTCASRPLRTLQVLSEGSKLDVPGGAKLRLVYLASGKKESVTGPCQVMIGAHDSKVVGGKGQVTVERAARATTRLRKSENIRRMGGSLQAAADPEADAEDVLALLPVQDMASSNPAEVPPPTRPTRSVTIDPNYLMMVDLPMASATADTYRRLVWRGGESPFRVTLREDDQVLFTRQVEDRAFELPKEDRLIPGKIYEVAVAGEGLEAPARTSFTILLPSDRSDLQAQIDDFAELLGGTERDRLMARIAVDQEWGLWQEALEAATTAVAAYPLDAGFQTELGRTLFLLGQLEEAQLALTRAQELGGQPITEP